MEFSQIEASRAVEESCPCTNGHNDPKRPNPELLKRAITFCRVLTAEMSTGHQLNSTCLAYLLQGSRPRSHGVHCSRCVQLDESLIHSVLHTSLLVIKAPAYGADNTADNLEGLKIIKDVIVLSLARGAGEVGG